MTSRAPVPMTPYSFDFYLKDPAIPRDVPINKLIAAYRAVPNGYAALDAACPGLMFGVCHSDSSDSDKLIPSYIIEKLFTSKDPLVMRVCQRLWKLLNLRRIRISGLSTDPDWVFVSSPYNFAVWTEEGVKLEPSSDDDHVTKEQSLAFNAIRDAQLKTKAYRKECS